MMKINTVGTGIQGTCLQTVSMMPAVMYLVVRCLSPAGRDPVSGATVTVSPTLIRYPALIMTDRMVLKKCLYKKSIFYHLAETLHSSDF